MSPLSVLFLLFTVSFARCSPYEASLMSGFDAISVKVTDASFSLTVSYNDGIHLTNSAYGVHCEGVWFTTKGASPSLALEDHKVVNKSDQFGYYTEYIFYWNGLTQLTPFKWITAIQAYLDFPAVIFRQEFPTGCRNMSVTC